MNTDKQLERGDYDYRVSDGLLFCKWMDKKAVTTASNYYGTAPTSVKSTQKDGTRDQAACPEAVRDYNMYMGGVDMADMFLSSYGLNRKSKKW
ncbi:PiggyBac transposable element-derived protein 4 [Plakobranchus ocellatus]|uniref:PiggyBac transposable element-derived protein 4 n=1 Tax=Plakobranchus ocellatus TaxID=259542 RepID=A0AAV4DYQ6_9GAST|nr:PiggyBac transposable element-derived protein 4 [Plakobranchus ocellatus]